MGLETGNRLDIDYKIIHQLEDLVYKVDACIKRKDWKMKEELEKEYFRIYDSLNKVHKDYIEQRKQQF